MTVRKLIPALILAFACKAAHADRFGAGTPEKYAGRIVAINCGFGFGIVDFGADRGLQVGDSLLVEDLAGILLQLPVRMVEARTAVIDLPENHSLPIGTPIKIGMATRPVNYP